MKRYSLWDFSPTTAGAKMGLVTEVWDFKKKKVALWLGKLKTPWIIVI